MYVIRPVAADDLAGLLWLAESAGIGLTTLPPSEKALAEKITASAQAFSADLEAPVYESYLLVLEDIGSGRIVGTTGLFSRLEPEQFIADLMPKYPLYVPLLPPEAQAVIGKVHEATAPAQRLLEREGFRYEGYVDIFDAGPTLQVPLSDIRTVRENRRVAVTAVAQELETPICLIARTDLNFRACLGPAMQTDDGVVLTSEVLDALQLGLEDSVRYIEL